MTKIKLKGTAARNFFAERMVDRLGDKAIDETAGPMREAVQGIIDVRLSTRGTGVDLRDIVGPLNKEKTGQ